MNLGSSQYQTAASNSKSGNPSATISPAALRKKVADGMLTSVFSLLFLYTCYDSNTLAHKHCTNITFHTLLSVFSNELKEL